MDKLGELDKKLSEDPHEEPLRIVIDHVKQLTDRNLDGQTRTNLRSMISKLYDSVKWGEI